MSWSLGVIGCGKMAYALIKGISRDVTRPDSIYVSDPDLGRIALFEADFDAIRLPIDELIRESSVIILAVKPGQVDEVLQNNACWSSEKLLISVAAGVKTMDLEKALADQEVHIVRVMPNTPCLVGEGLMAISAGTYATESDLEFVQTLLFTSGQTILVPEKDMDAVTAVSGSGPAYVFLLVEAMQEAAVNVGLSSQTARQLVLQTIKGSIAMLEVGGEHPAVLKEQVCSPGGTTIAGIRQLEAGGVRSAFFNAISAAHARSIELGKPKK